MVLGIIGAMSVEVEHLINIMVVDRIVERTSMTFHAGKLNGLQAVVVQCGVGKVNAAVCTQILIDEFGVDAVINTGIAGSLDSSIEIGDIVVSTAAVHHDVDVEIFGYSKGEIPGLKTVEIPADENLHNLAAGVLRSQGVRVFEGLVCTGDCFVGSQEEKARITTTFGGLCVEMEGAAIAQAAYLNHIPFVIVRAISDKADGTADVDYPTFETKAAYDCACLVSEFAKQLATN